jgi:hypothetical protein
MRHYSDVDERTALDVYDDGRGPFITFAHNPGEAEKCRELGYDSDESFEHQHLKGALAKTAERHGWKARLEVPGDGCRADVVIDHPSRQRRVLEAQVSPLPTDVALRRHDLYVSQFGPTTWTHTRQRPWATQIESLRVADDLETVIDGVYEDQSGDVKAPPAPITAVLPKVLSGELRYVHWQSGSGDFGFFSPLGAAPATTVGRRLRKAMVRRGEDVEECWRATLVDRSIPCVNCGFATQAGHRCANPVCAPPSCPGCGSRPWHHRAICRACGAGRLLTRLPSSTAPL